MHVRLLLETTPRRTFASALDWPGLARSGRDEGAALAALSAALPRYARVAAAAGVAFDPAGVVLDVVERQPGSGSTAYGVPAVVADADREPTDAAEARRLAALVEGAWRTFDVVASTAPETLRTGPRGGGRSRSEIVAHVVAAEVEYGRVMGRRPRADDATAEARLRADLGSVLREPSDGSPLAARRWPPRYAARRIAWHALDHAWEIEDRTDPA